jgi:hypothetical protein
VEWDDVSFAADICSGNVEAAAKRLVKQHTASNVMNRNETNETSSQSKKMKSTSSHTASANNDIIVLDDLTEISGRNKLSQRSLSACEEVIVLDDNDDDSFSNKSPRGIRKPSAKATPNNDVILLDSDDESSDSFVHVLSPDMNEIEVIDDLADRHSTALQKLILVTGLYQYDEEFYKDLSTILKNLYHNYKASASDDFTEYCQNQFTLSQGNEVPLVCRENILFWLVYLQMKGFHVEVVRQKTKHRQQLMSPCQLESPAIQAEAESPSRRPVNSEARRRLSAASSQPDPECIVYTNPSQQHTSTTPAFVEATKHIDVASSKPSSRPPRHPSGRKVDPRQEQVRLARLARFDNPKPRSGPTNISAERNTLDDNDDDDGWICTVCTLNNPMQVEKCGACGSWKCKLCTLINPATNMQCTACEAPCAESNGVVIKPSPPMRSYPTSPTIPSDAVAREHIMSSDTKRRKVKCGACGAEGHNRANATEFNCTQYYAPSEINRRNKIREKQEKKAREAQQQISDLERQKASLATQLEEHRRSSARLEQALASNDALRTNEIKRLEKEKKRAQKQAQKYS